MIGNDGKYKLIGWDDAEIIDDKNSVYNDFVGSNIYYLSPETAQIRHGWELKKIDVFAIGVCIFILSFGMVPFTGIHHANICKKIQNGQINWPSHNKWNRYISSRLKQFLQSMLSSYPYSRTSAHDALLLPFLAEKPSKNNGYDENLKPLISDVPFKLHCYESSMKIRRLLIDHECDEWTNFEQNELIKCLNQVFDLQKEQINPVDLQNLLIKMGLNKTDSEKKAKHLFQIIDPSLTGHINAKSSNNDHQRSERNERIYSNSQRKDFQYTPIATSQIQLRNNVDGVETMINDDDIEESVSDLH